MDLLNSTSSKVLAFLFLGFGLIGDSNSSARLLNCGEKVCHVLIEGVINQSDPENLDIIFDAIGNSNLAIINLNSRGGDVEASLAMGRAIRARNSLTSVPSDATCASACVFVLAAGVNKSVLGAVAVHRPYMGEVGDFSSEYIKKRHNQIKTTVQQYLSEMNVPKNLYEFMYSIKPEESYRLSNEELRQFMLVGSDPVYSERMSAKKAARLGITRIRLMELENYCLSSVAGKNIYSDENSLKVYVDCMSRIENGFLK